MEYLKDMLIETKDMVIPRYLNRLNKAVEHQDMSYMKTDLDFDSSALFNVACDLELMQEDKILELIKLDEMLFDVCIGDNEDALNDIENNLDLEDNSSSFDYYDEDDDEEDCDLVCDSQINEYYKLYDKLTDCDSHNKVEYYRNFYQFTKQLLLDLETALVIVQLDGYSTIEEYEQAIVDITSRMIRIIDNANFGYNELSL